MLKIYFKHAALFEMFKNQKMAYGIFMKNVHHSYKRGKKLNKTTF